MSSTQVFKDYPTTVIPAWSLHRLIELAYGNWKEDIAPIYLGNSYDMLIGRIEFQVKQGKFNKEYLVDLTGTDSHQDMVDAFGYAFEAMKAKKEE